MVSWGTETYLIDIKDSRCYGVSRNPLLALQVLSKFPNFAEEVVVLR